MSSSVKPAGPSAPAPTNMSARKAEQADQGSSAAEGLIDWLLSLKIKAEDAEAYEAKMEEMGIDCVDHLQAVSLEDLTSILGMKPFHAKIVHKNAQEYGQEKETADEEQKGADAKRKMNAPPEEKAKRGAEEKAACERETEAARKAPEEATREADNRAKREVEVDTPEEQNKAALHFLKMNKIAPEPTASVHKKPAISHPFWLVSDIAVESHDVLLETTTAKVFTKWHFQDPEFLKNVHNKVHDDEGKPLDSKDDKLENLRKGEMIKGISLVSDGSSQFPVNEDLMFSNQTEPPTFFRKLSWVQYDKEKNRVSQQLVFRVTLHTSFNMKEYPYDRHMIPFALATRQWKQKMDDGKEIKHVWNLETIVPEWAPKDYPEDKSIVSDNIAWIDKEQELDHMIPCFFKQKNKPVLCIRLQRNPRFILQQITVPMLCTVWLCFAFFCFDFNNVDSRAEGILLSVLVAAQYRSTIATMIPAKTYMTLADKYFLFAFVYHLLLMMKTLVSFHHQAKGVGMFFDFGPGWYDVAEGDNSLHFDWVKIGERQYWDDVTTWSLWVIWVALHLMLYLDVWWRATSGVDHHGFLDGILRPSWDQVRKRCAVDPHKNASNKEVLEKETEKKNMSEKEAKQHVDEHVQYCFDCDADDIPRSMWHCNCTQ